MTDWRPFAPLDDEAPTGALATAEGRRGSADQPVSGKTANYAAEAAIKAGDPRFRRYLCERHGLQPPLTKERATQRLRSVLGVMSRRELNVPGGIAADRWRALRSDFDHWLKAQNAGAAQWRGGASSDSRRVRSGPGEANDLASPATNARSHSGGPA